jgi:hypothetical protein
MEVVKIDENDWRVGENGGSSAAGQDSVRHRSALYHDELV